MLKLNSKEQKIWFTSDTHYWHKNMTYGVSVWQNKEENCRMFDTTKEMSDHIVDQINKYVGEDDILFHLGDWSFGGINNIWNFRKRIKCKNIHLIWGNHDHHITKNKELPNCWIGCVPDLFYDTDEDYMGRRADAQELFKSTQVYLEVDIDKTLVCMMHYPIQEWNDRFKRSYHLFGHVHGRIPHGNSRCDVGMDYAFKVFGEYRPFSWDDIIKLLGHPHRPKDNKVKEVL